MKSINGWKYGLLCGVLALMAGCAVVREAREAQKAAWGRATGAEAEAPRVDLRQASLAELVNWAQTNRPSKVQAALATEDARLSLRELAADAPLLSRTPWYAPHLNVSGGYSASSASAHFDNLKTRTDGNASAGLSLELPVWDAGRHAARIHAASERVIAAETSLMVAGYDVFEEVANAYFNVLEKDALLAVAFTNVSQHAERLKRAKERLDAGEGRELDVLRARLDLAMAREEVVSASNDVQTAGAELVRSLGLDVARASRLEIMEMREDALDAPQRGFADTTGTAREIYTEARLHSPTVKLARERLRAASAELDYAIADLKPSLSASLSLNWTDPLWYWRWGVNAAQSLFVGGRKKTAVERARVELARAAAEVDRVEQQLSHDLEVAIAVRDNARKSLVTATVSLGEAKKNLDTLTEQLALGDASRVEFTEAVASYILAMGNRVKAFYFAQRAEVSLFRLTGRPPVYQEERVKDWELKR